MMTPYSMTQPLKKRLGTTMKVTQMKKLKRRADSKQAPRKRMKHDQLHKQKKSSSAQKQKQKQSKSSNQSKLMKQRAKFHATTKAGNNASNASFNVRSMPPAAFGGPLGLIAAAAQEVYEKGDYALGRSNVQQQQNTVAQQIPVQQHQVQQHQVQQHQVQQQQNKNTMPQMQMFPQKYVNMEYLNALQRQARAQAQAQAQVVQAQAAQAQAQVRRPATMKSQQPLTSGVINPYETKALQESDEGEGRPETSARYTTVEEKALVHAKLRLQISSNMGQKNAGEDSLLTQYYEYYLKLLDPTGFMGYSKREESALVRKFKSIKSKKPMLVEYLDSIIERGFWMQLKEMVVTRPKLPVIHSKHSNNTNRGLVSPL